MAIPSIEEKKLPLADETKRYLIKRLLKECEDQDYSVFSDSTMRRHTIGIRGYETICTTRVPDNISGIRYSEIGYTISPITTKQWENNKYLEEDKFVEVICTGKEFSNLVNYVYRNQLGKIEGEKYTKQKIKEDYKNFTREVYLIMKEDEVNNEHEKNDHSLP